MHTSTKLPSTQFFDTLRIKDLFFILALVGVTWGVNIIPLAFTIYVIVIHSKQLSIPSNILLFLTMILVSGTLAALIQITVANVDQTFISDIFLRIRFYFIRIAFALATTLYVSKLRIQEIINVIASLSFLASLLAVAQIMYNIVYLGEFRRISMFATESSAAAMFYVFAVPILIWGYYRFGTNRDIMLIFTVLGLFILSKAQLLVLIFWSSVYLIHNRKKFALWPFIVLFVFLTLPYIFQIKQVGDTIHFLSVLSEYGLYGLNASNQIWTSFTFRVSGAISAAEQLYQNPFGVGFGLFHATYLETMQYTDLGRYLSGREILEVLAGERYATPKAAVIELMVSCGFFFIIPLLILVVGFLKKKLPLLINISFLSILIIGMMVELAPFLSYFSILIVLGGKMASKNIVAYQTQSLL